MKNFAVTAALVSLLSATGAQAASHYTSLLVFGDSLSDDGNLYASIGVPPAPYFEGRTSNGPVWADHLAADFAAKGLHSGNYAYAYGQAVTNVDTRFVDFQVPDLPAQIEAFKASGTSGLLGDRPVATLWLGSNDLFTAMPAGPASVFGAMTSAALAIGGGIEALADGGIHDFVVLNMVPIDRTPRFTTLGTPQEAALAKFGVEVFNDTLKAVLAGFGGDTRVKKIDMHAVMGNLLDNPADFGVSDVSTPCYLPVPGAVPCTPEEADERVFWDPVHPTGEMHAAIADVARGEIAPIPLPAPLALLLAGLAGLTVIGARRRA